MEVIHCENIAEPNGHYSLAVRQGELIFLSGILPDLGKEEAQNFEAQMRSAFAKCQAILSEANCDLKNIVSCTAYIVGIENWGLFNSVYADVMGEHRPARAVIPVPTLHFGASIEIQIVASVQ